MTSPFGTSAASLSPAAADERVSAFLRGVYGWMFGGLLVTAAVALAAASSPALVQTLVSNRILFFGTDFGELSYQQMRISRHPGHPFQTIPDSVSEDGGHRFRLIPDRVSA